MEKIPVVPEKFMGIEVFDSKEEYAYLCVLLMFLEDKDAGEQFILSQLTEYMTTVLPGSITDWTLYTNRRRMNPGAAVCCGTGDHKSDRWCR